MILPRVVYRSFWALHKAVFRLSGGRLGTTWPGRRVGTLFLLSRGRGSGEVRRNGLYYLEDGPNLVVVASNAGASRDPRWWRDLEARPDAEVDVPNGRRRIRARSATPIERDRLWPRLVAAHPPYAEYARTASRPIPIVVLEPR